MIIVFDFDNDLCWVNILFFGEIVDGGCKGNIVLEYIVLKLYKFLDNMCEFFGIIKIVLLGNIIFDILNLLCFLNLMYLDLLRNKIIILW